MSHRIIYILPYERNVLSITGTGVLSHGFELGADRGNLLRDIRLSSREEISERRDIYVYRARCAGQKVTRIDPTRVRRPKLCQSVEFFYTAAEKWSATG